MKVHANTLRLDLLATTRFSVAILVRALQFAISIHFNMTKPGWVWCGRFCKNGEAVFWNFHHTMDVENLQVGLNAATTFSLLPRHNCTHEYLQDLKFWQTKVRRSFLWLLYVHRRMVQHLPCALLCSPYTFHDGRQHLCCPSPQKPCWCDGLLWPSRSSSAVSQPQGHFLATLTFFSSYR